MEIEHPPEEIVATQTTAAILINGEPLSNLPHDLYIPPEALQVFLEAFEGPLDLLLYLIKKQNLDILNIPIADVTRQYMSYIDLMQEMCIELAADYLLMAAMLAEIKSRYLLPRQATMEEDVDDPRAELVRRLQEYERFKQAAENLDEVPRRHRDLFETKVKTPNWAVERALPDVSMQELLLALKDVMARVQMSEHHQIEREPLSVRERMSDVLDKLAGKEYVEFQDLFPVDEGRSGVVVTFLAVLELSKEMMIEIVQQSLFAPIHVRARAV